jgi:hypothetical protein
MRDTASETRTIDTRPASTTSRANGIDHSTRVTVVNMASAANRIRVPNPSIFLEWPT